MVFEIKQTCIIINEELLKIHRRGSSTYISKLTYFSFKHTYIYLFNSSRDYKLYHFGFLKRIKPVMPLNFRTPRIASLISKNIILMVFLKNHQYKPRLCLYREKAMLYHFQKSILLLENVYRNHCNSPGCYKLKP